MERKARTVKLTHIGVAIISLGVKAVSWVHKGFPGHTTYLQACAPTVFMFMIKTPVSVHGHLSTMQLSIITQLAGGYWWYL